MPFHIPDFDFQIIDDCLVNPSGGTFILHRNFSFVMVLILLYSPLFARLLTSLSRSGYQLWFHILRGCAYAVMFLSSDSGCFVLYIDFLMFLFRFEAKFIVYLFIRFSIHL